MKRLHIRFDYRISRAWVACSVAALSMLASAPTALAGEPLFAADRPLDMEHIRLETKVDLVAKRLDAIADLTMKALRPVSAVHLDAVGFEVESVSCGLGKGDVESCEYVNDGSHLDIELPHEIKTGTPVHVRIQYHVVDPSQGLSFFGPTDDEPDAPYVVWSQGETTTNRYWVPCFDHPNEKQTTEIVCTVKAPNIAISNGRLEEKSERPDGTRVFHWIQDKPHAAYLMTLIVGEFVSRTDTWRGRPVTYYVRPKFKDEIGNSFNNTTKMLDFFSDHIGVEYPWDQYAQTCCYRFGGGMENTSATTLTEDTLHDDRAHHDTSSDGLVAHELAHQWWGDLLTCRDWAHTWLNEGFASYFEALWAEEDQGADEFAYNMFRKAGDAIRGGKDKPIVYHTYDNNWDQFDSRAYPKGAWVLHMMRRRLGDDLFWQCLKTYCERNKFKAVETVDLRKAIEEVTGQSFERFFYDWTERPGNPEVTARFEWLDDDKLASLHIEQTQKTDAFNFPLRIEFRVAGQAEPVIVNRNISEKVTNFLVPLPARPNMVRIDPEQAVLMELKENKPRDLWVTQLTDDPNVAARVMAARHFGDSDADQDRKLLVERLMKDPFWAVQAAIAKALNKSGGDVAREGLLAAINVENPKARAAVIESLGQFGDVASVSSALRSLIEKDESTYNVQSAAIGAYSEKRPEGAVAFLTPLMSRESDGDTIRAAVLRGLAKQQDPAALDVLLTWANQGKPSRCRIAAVDGMGQLIAEANVTKKRRDEAVRVITDCLKQKTRYLPGVALRVLGGLGSRARSALPDIDALAARDNTRLQDSAKDAAKKIREGRPPQVQLADVRTELDGLREENKRLMSRLEKLEAVMHEGGNPSQASAPGKSETPASATKSRHGKRAAPVGASDRGDATH